LNPGVFPRNGAHKETGRQQGKGEEAGKREQAQIKSGSIGSVRHNEVQKDATQGNRRRRLRKIGISQTEHITLEKQQNRRKERERNANRTGGNVLVAIQISQTQFIGGREREKEALGRFSGYSRFEISMKNSKEMRYNALFRDAPFFLLMMRHFWIPIHRGKVGR
jgi:hypothetical protein